MKQRHRRCVRRIALLALAAALALSACNNSSETFASPAAQPAATPDSPLSLSVYIDDESWRDKAWGEDLVSGEIMRLQNVSLSIRTPSGYADSSAQLNLMEMSGEFPDLLVLPADMRAFRLMKRGAFLELNGMILERGGNIRKNIGMLDYLSIFCAVGGRIYALPYSTQSAKGARGIQGVLVLKGLYEQMGSPPLSSFQDLRQYLLRLHQEQVYSRSGKLIYPSYFDDPAAALISMYGARAISIFGLTFLQQDDGQLRHLMRTGQGRDAYTFFNLLHREKLIDGDWMMKTHEDSLKKILDGGVGVYFSNDAARWSDQYNRLVLAQSGDSYRLVLPSAGVSSSNYRGVRPDHFLCIGKNTPNPTRVFDFLDWMASPEGQYVSLLGPKGTALAQAGTENPILAETLRQGDGSGGSDVGGELFSNDWGLLHIDRFQQDALGAMLAAPAATARAQTLSELRKSFWTMPVIDAMRIDPYSQAGYACISSLTYIKEIETQLYMAGDTETFDHLYAEALARLDELQMDEIENALNVQLGFPDIHAHDNDYFELPEADQGSTLP